MSDDRPLPCDRRPWVDPGAAGPSGPHRTSRPHRRLGVRRAVLTAAACVLVAGACTIRPSVPDGSTTTSSSTSTTAPTTSTTAPTSTVPSGDGDAVDLTHLPVGDDQLSTEPEVGSLWSCQTSFTGGGASTQGPWFNGDGTWDATKKATVDGEVDWPSSFAVAVEGDDRVFTGNDLPDHPTGSFPVSSADDAYQFDRNPNAIASQSLSFRLPASPASASSPSCVGGEVGVLQSGAMLFNAVDAGGRDAVAWEVQDDCDGHPQRTGVYHYHSVSDCVNGIHETDENGHSVLIGYAFDGYGIYGHHDVDGQTMTNADLDECHGHVGPVEWEGEIVEMYHYHATYEFPYTVGCFHGTPTRVVTGG